MKSIYNKDQRLESHRFFPILAWIVVIGFVIFVYTLVTDLQAAASELREKNQKLGQSASLEVKNITDFSR